MEQPKHPEDREKSQEQPCYYGTGRRRETDRSRLPLIVSLLAVILAANMLTIALHFEQSHLDEQETAKEDADASVVSAYPERNDSQMNVEGEITSFGMELSAMDEAERRYWELPEGLVVRSVASESVAARAGILQGDVLLCVGETAVRHASDYFAALKAARAGNTVTLTVYRCGTYYALELTIPAVAQDSQLAS